jgi:very-short-patch-repair endonuclease/predicted transcriptional regulator of viral defense system
MTDERSVGHAYRDKASVRPDAKVATLAAGQWGIVDVAELAECGLSRAGVNRRAHAGHLHALYRGVYAVGHPTVPLEGRFLAAVKACGRSAALSHFPAAAHLGFMDWEDRLIDVTIPANRRRRHPGLRVHSSSFMAVGEVTRHRGIRVTTPARTLLDLASCLSEKALRRLVRRAQSMRLVNVRQITAILVRHPRRRGAAKLRRIVATGPAPTRSELEDVVLDLILAAGFAHPDVNVALQLDGRRVIPDFRWPGHRLVIEADSAEWHDNQQAREDDAERQALLEAHGERVVRITWRQAVSQPSQTVARLWAAGAPTDG